MSARYQKQTEIIDAMKERGLSVRMLGDVGLGWSYWAIVRNIAGVHSMSPELKEALWRYLGKIPALREVGERLKKRRSELGVSIYRLNAITDVAEKSIWKLEHGMCRYRPNWLLDVFRALDEIEEERART